MKKITHTTYRKGDGKNPFFWNPWGWIGCFGRLLCFLLILMIVMWILNLFRGCERRGGAGVPGEPVIEWPDSICERMDSIINWPGKDTNPIVPVDTSTSWRRNIDNPGSNLPDPQRNFIPDVDPDNIVIDPGGEKVVGDKLNVILDSDANDNTFRQWADEFKKLYPGAEYSVVFYDPNTKLIQIEVPPYQREKIMRELPNQITDISFKIFPEGLLGPAQSNVNKPNDPVFCFPMLSWYFAPIQAFEAWDITTGDPDVKVAIVDSYFDLYHDDLNSNRIFAPYSVKKRNGNVAPDERVEGLPFYHGSMVASMALGNQNNNRGSSGIAPNVTFIPVSLGNQFTTMTILNGVLYSIYKGANVINLSLGLQFSEEVMEAPIEVQAELSKKSGLEQQAVWDYVTDLATKRNITLVWAAGNEDLLIPLDPSKRDKYAIRVSGVNQKLAKWGDSNFGNLPEYDFQTSDISAPSTMMFGAMPFNSYNMGDGTSYAAPVVTGAVALMKSLDPSLTNSEIIQILQETAIPPSDGSTTIGPVIQIKNALDKVKENFARMDDLLQDHNKLIGFWASTELLTAIDHNGPTGEMNRAYFEFHNPDNGIGIVYEVGSKRDYTANVKVTWFPDNIVFTTTRYTSPGAGKNYVAETITCLPDENGLIKCFSETKEFGKAKPYYLKRVNSRIIE